MKKNYLVEKRNVLNEIRTDSMTLPELRLFSIYLSRINSRDTETRKVRFTLVEFQKIMEFENKVKVKRIKVVTDGLLGKVVNVPIEETGGYTAFQLFKECTVSADEKGTWYVEIDAHDKALPLMFEFKEKYFTYELWNALKLKSPNQLRMYEILKQYEYKGERIISVADLKALLGILPGEYSDFNNFKVRVLDACQQALEEYTDIKFTYEPTGEKGRGGKILMLKFIISKNESFVDKISLDEFLGTLETPLFKNEQLEFLAGACGNEFDEAEMQVLYNLMLKIIPPDNKAQIERYDYLKRKYDELKWRAERTEIKNRFGYLKTIIEADIAAID